MNILEIVRSVLTKVLLSEIVAVALYNFIFNPKSEELKRAIGIMFSAIAIGFTIFYVLAVKDVSMVSGDGSIRNVLLKIIPMVLDVIIIYFLSKDIFSEIKAVMSIKKSSHKIKNSN